MDDFSAKPGVPNLYGLLDQANSIAQARMLSSMTPTVVEKRKIVHGSRNS
jgi:gamma-glutamyltranspeptidase/glutathione hydrolase